MGNINDYRLWRGDIPINKETDFNEVDSMILARFSYLRFDKIELKEKETIESISNKMKNLKNEEFRYNGDKELITYLGESIRFKNMLVTDYIKINDNKTEKQFGAVTIHISDNEMYISYIGTDNTLHGWKESFSMMYVKDLPCQINGREYLEKFDKSVYGIAFLYFKRPSCNKCKIKRSKIHSDLTLGDYHLASKGHFKPYHQ